MKAVHALLIALAIVAGLAAGYLAGVLTAPATAIEQVQGNKTECPIMHLSLDKEKYAYGENIGVSYYSEVPLKKYGPPYIAKAAEFRVYKFENHSWKELVLPDQFTRCINGTIVRSIPIGGALDQKSPLEQVNVTFVWNATYYGFVGSDSCEVRQIEPGWYKAAVSYEYNGTEITVAKEFDVLRTPAAGLALKLRLDKEVYKQGENITISYYSEVPVSFTGQEVRVYKKFDFDWKEILVPWGLTECREGKVYYRTIPEQMPPHQVNSTLVWDGAYYVLTGPDSCETKQIEPDIYKVAIPYEYNGVKMTVEEEFSVTSAA